MENFAYRHVFALILVALSLVGCGGNGNKKKCHDNVTCGSGNQQTALLNMPHGKSRKSETKRLFDEDIAAFVLDDEKVQSGDNVTVAHNDAEELTWQQPQEQNQQICQMLHFDYDSSEAPKLNNQELAKNVASMKDLTDKGQTVVFKGHACRAGRANAAYNLSLSNERAHKTAQMYAQAGIPKECMKVFGVGYEEPCVLEDSPTRVGQAPNRRVEIYTINA